MNKMENDFEKEIKELIGFDEDKLNFQKRLREGIPNLTHTENIEALKDFEERFSSVPKQTYWGTIADFGVLKEIRDTKGLREHQIKVNEILRKLPVERPEVIEEIERRIKTEKVRILEELYKEIFEKKEFEKQITETLITGEVSNKDIDKLPREPLTCPPRSDPIVILGSDGGKLWEKEDFAPNRS